MPAKKYALRYTWEAEADGKGYLPSDIKNDLQGLCDAMIVVSIVKPPDGSYSELIMSLDGETQNELTDKDLFKHFGMLAARLSESKTLHAWQKNIADLTIKMLRDIIVNNK